MNRHTGVRTVLWVIGVVCVLGGLLALQWLFLGLFVIVGLLIEARSYKPPQVQVPDPRWQDTGERFVDPGSGELTAVYFDPASSERHYVVVRSGR